MIKTGFISLIGRPSSGKSTLINKILDYKVSIVSSHPQTTRFTIRGIYNDRESQMVFIDTPGFHHHNSILNRGLSKLALNTLEDGDVILYLVDCSRSFGEEEQAIIEAVKKYQEKLIVAVNKTDKKELINENTINSIKKRLPGSEIIRISALNGDNIPVLLTRIKQLLNEGPLYYPTEFVTDQSIPFRIEETVREKIFQSMQEEIPHAVYVKTIDLKVNDHKITAHANIFVERNSQKGMIIGKNGTNIKKIGQNARLELSGIFEKPVDLFLKVKVHQNWKKNKNFINNMFKLS